MRLIQAFQFAQLEPLCITARISSVTGVVLGCQSACTVRVGLIVIVISDEFSTVKGAAVCAVPVSIPYPQGYQAILIVGASWDENVGRIYRILNSWGNDWADGGYTWLPALYVDRYTAAAIIA